MSFIDVVVETDPEVLKQQVYEAIQAVWPEWEPADGNLETWMIEAFVNQTADLTDLAADVPTAIFKEFGTTVMGIPPLEASPATGLTTWTMNDTDGYTIAAGTVIGVAASGSSIVAFAVDTEFTIDPGDDTAAAIPVTAVVDGADGGGLDGTVSLIDSLDYVASVSLDSATTGGSDAEADQDYLDRLTSELQLLTPRPILPNDFAVLARETVGVARAIAIDGYNPDDDSYDNERMVAVAMVDEAGEAVSGGIKTAVQADLDAKREVNFIVNVMDPTYTEVDVEATVMALEGYAADDVEAAVVTRLTDFLDPATWGVGLTDSKAWRVITSLRINEIIAQIDLAVGVDYVVAGTAKISEHPDATAAADLTLDAPAQITRPNTITITVDVP